MTRNIEVVIDEQRFLRLTEDITGGSRMYVYRGRCADCGKLFEQTARATALASGNLVRRCAEHRRAGPVDSAKMHKACRQPVPRPAGAATKKATMFDGDMPKFTPGDLVRALVKLKSLPLAMRAIGVTSRTRIRWVEDRLVETGWIGRPDQDGLCTPTPLAIEMAELGPPAGAQLGWWPGLDLTSIPTQMLLRLGAKGHPGLWIIVDRQRLRESGSLEALMKAQGAALVRQDDFLSLAKRLAASSYLRDADGGQVCQ